MPDFIEAECTRCENGTVKMLRKVYEKADRPRMICGSCRGEQAVDNDIGSPSESV